MFNTRGIFRIAVGGLLAALSAGLTACSKPAPSAPALASAPRAEPAVRLEGLDGAWTADCVDPQDGGLSAREVMQFNGSSFTRKLDISPRGDCSTSYMSVVMSGTFNRQAEVRPGVFNFDFTTTSARVRPIDDQAARVLSLAHECGVTSWSAGQEVDVIARLGSDDCFHRYPRHMYTVQSLADGKLYFGAGDSFSSSAARPVVIETGIEYKRK